eukprot:CFRG8593T1
MSADNVCIKGCLKNRTSENESSILDLNCASKSHLCNVSLSKDYVSQVRKTFCLFIVSKFCPTFNESIRKCAGARQTVAIVGEDAIYENPIVGEDKAYENPIVGEDEVYENPIVGKDEDDENPIVGEVEVLRNLWARNP